MAYLGMNNPAVFKSAIRDGVALTYTVDALLGGRPVAGATGMAPTGGSITDTTKPGVRRMLNLELAPLPGLFDLLSPTGTQLKVTARVQYTDRTSVTVPMGLFEVDNEKLAEGGGSLSVTAPDKWARIMRARFIQPVQSSPGMLVTQQIAQLIKGALGASESVTITATSTATMNVVTWEKDRDQAITDLAAGIGAWVYFDRLGVPTIANLPTPAAVGAADWLVDAGATGVLTDLDRERSRASTSNVVVVESSSTDPETVFATQCVWDSDPGSPTYAGPDPINHPDLAGPFGIAVDYFESPLPLGNDGAWQAGMTRLARTTGLASQVSLGQVPNCAVDAYDVIDVLPPGQTAVHKPPIGGGQPSFPSGGLFPGASTFPDTDGRPGSLTFRSTRTVERHIADTVTHPLSVGSTQHIDGRSTRADLL